MMRRFFFALALFFPLAAHAQALPCAAYPNTLTNGTLADANQVMANFNTIRNCVNALAPLGVPVVGSSSNVRSNVASASASATVTADSVTVGTALNGTSYTLTSYSQTFNGATTGAGGMDTGTLPTSGWVALYAIYNPTAPTISILGTNCASACPTVYAGANMPAGYTASALLTVFPTNGTPQIPASTYARGKHVYEPVITALNTGTTHGSVTTLTITGSVPPVAIGYSGTLVNICGTTPGSVNLGINIYSDSTVNSNFQVSGNCVSINSAAFVGAFTDFPITTAQTTFYENNVTGAGTSPASQILIIGYLIP